MKKIIFTLLMAIIFCNVNAQKIARSETDMTDVYNALEVLGLKMYKFTIPVDTTNIYNIIVHFDEYYKDSVESKNTTWNLGKTFNSFINDDNGERILLIPKDFTFTINDSDAANRKINIKTYGFDLQKLNGVTKTLNTITGNSYDSRPFIEQEFVSDKKIPMMLFGSFWYDERFNINRFCGSNELPPNLDDDIIHSCPHYIIVSLEFRTIK